MIYPTVRVTAPEEGKCAKDRRFIFPLIDGQSDAVLSWSVQGYSDGIVLGKLLVTDGQANVAGLSFDGRDLDAIDGMIDSLMVLRGKMAEFAGAEEEGELEEGGEN